MPSNPRVGVGVFVMNGDQKFIIGRRKGSHGGGAYALPGGHLEFGESFSECAAREVLEETGLAVSDIHFLTATNDIMHRENKHYVTVFVVCKSIGDNMEPKVMEPEKCEAWEWTTWKQIQSWAENQMRHEESGDAEEIESSRRLFLPLFNLVKAAPPIRESLNLTKQSETVDVLKSYWRSQSGLAGKPGKHVKGVCEASSTT